MSKFTKKLISVVEDEWEFFGFSRKELDGTTKIGRVEYEDGIFMRVNEFWRLVHKKYKPKYAHLTGKDRGWPWSAAFISYCMDQAGAGTDFSYSAGHFKYINDAIRAMDNENSKAIFRAHKKKDYTLKTGDMIAYWWGEKKITIENARKIGWYNSHCDIVTEVGANKVKVIGGNVSNSVTQKTLKTNSKGQLTDTSKKWFVVLECQK